MTGLLMIPSVAQQLCNSRKSCLHVYDAACVVQRCALSRVYRTRVVSASLTPSASEVATALPQHNSVLQASMPFVLPSAALIATAAYAVVIPMDAGAPWLRPLLLASGPLLLHGLLPLLDLLLGEQHQPPLPATAKAPPADDFSSRLVPTLVILAHLAVAATALATVTTTPLQPHLLTLLTLSLATSAAAALAAGHELVHSRHPVHLAAAATFLTTYWWFPYYRCHPQHHLHVATPLDYTTAGKGRDIYSYTVPYLFGSYAEAWQLAAQECDRAGKPRFGWHNSTLVALAAQAAVTAGIFAAFGPAATAVHLGSTVVLLAYMAIFDYVLHYGLIRPPMPGNARRNAPVTPYTSWNSLYRIENALMANVLLHSDHHMTGAKSYTWLRPPSAPRAPTFPAPINLLALSVLVPPLWMAIMDGRADDANARNIEYLGLAPGGAGEAGAAAASTAAHG